MANSILTTFLSALQASISVLITIAFGVLATQFGLIDEKSAQNVSHLCVKLFLPALLLTNIGSQLNHDSLWRYLPVIVWALAYNIISVSSYFSLQKLLKLPSSLTPASIFNNTTAFPLLLIQSLATTSIFKALLWDQDDTIDDALERAVSYFLINSMISNSFTFGLGPMLLGRKGSDSKTGESNHSITAADVHRIQSDPSSSQRDVERALRQESEAETDEIRANEETSLLPHPVNVKVVQAQHEGYKAGRKLWDKFPSLIQWLLGRVFTFVSAPLVGAIGGIIIGLVPPLQRVFFNDTEDGGFFYAWLTISAQNVGKLFPALQVILVGIKLSKSLLALKHHEDSGNMPPSATIIVLLSRFIIFPALSILVIFFLVLKTNILPGDPVLWFTMTIMHTGPPALELVSMADVNGADEQEKLSIAKLITICYCVSPVMAFTVLGSLKAIEAAEQQ